jgi:uncharacterized protein YndB with AHSA1/START domain
MTATIHPAPVRRAVTVNVPQARAFQVFTEGLGSWWPRSHSIGQSPQKTAVIEPREGGCWYEIGEDGSRCEWGRVLAWEPPARLLLAWQIGGDWRFDPDLVTEVELRFVAEDAERTRVELEHRHLERMGEAAERVREQISSPNGWGKILDLYAAAAQNSQQAEGQR